jgi:hypothetical protein
MLGLYALGAEISGDPVDLTAIPESRSASLTLGFALTGALKATFAIRANIGISFSTAASLTVRPNIAARLTIDFALSGRIQLAGKPLVLSAVPASYAARAIKADFASKALPSSFTVRGVQ